MDEYPISRLYRDARVMRIYAGTNEITKLWRSKAYDLVRPRIDAHDAGIAVEPRDWIFVHIAITAEQLQAAVDHLAERVGDPVLRHGCGHGVELALEQPLDALVAERFRDGRLGLAGGELELAVLEFDDFLPNAVRCLT